MRKREMLFDANDIWLVVFIVVAMWLIVFQYGAI
jgi:hypothetical protein